MRRMFGCACAFLLIAACPASAQVAPQRSGDPLAALSFSDPRLRPAPVSEPIETPGASLAPGVREGWTRFLAAEGKAWSGSIDRRTGWLEIAEGEGIPWIPGHGNHLTPEETGAAPRGVDLPLLEKLARGFLPRLAHLLGVDPASLALNRGRSGGFGGHVWYIDFDVVRDGLPIEGARVVFRVNNGNLVQVGTENLPAAGTPTPREKVTRKEALATLADYIGGFGAGDTFLDGGSLHLLPAGIAGHGSAQGFAPGRGRGLALVWDFLFRRKGSPGTWRGRVDAATGEVLELRDTNHYAQVSGGVYPDSYVFAGEAVFPMPFANLSTGGFTNAAGIYAFPGGAVSSTLDGQYVRIQDTCGAISKPASGSGRIAFGTSSGTDCATPGSGGAGNTHAARTQFYHLNRVKEIARGWLPGNTWLHGKLTANVNIYNTCNAFWDGFSVNFYRSGGACGNTGEIAGVAIHEYGHGLDDNDGNGFSPDNGTGEAYADFTAALTLHDSCVGPGFRSTNCSGFGDACTSCTGVRDIDWAKHVSNTPHTVENFTRTHCSSGDGYDGPCGRQGHCESQVATEALWDLAARDLPDAGGAAAWAVMERLWYLSRPTATSAFTCNTGAATWTSNGCSAGSLWRTLRAVDDDDGNLANGTPHSCHLFAAFDRHGIACPSDPGANVCFSACAPPAAPTVSLTGGDGQVALSWSDSGPGVVYDVYKTELGCDSGFIRIANDLTAASLLDTVVANGLAYSYRVIAHPAGNEACGAAPSSCQSVTPQGPPCAPPAAPAGVSASPLGTDRIRVSWNASAGATDYGVYRATSSGGPYTLVAMVATPGTEFLDTGLAEATAYHYVVRALAEDCASGNSAEAAATTPACFAATLYSNDFEAGSGLSDWTVTVLRGTGPGDWRGIQTCAAHSGGRIFRYGDTTCTGLYQNSLEAVAVPKGATGIAVPEDASRVRLSFWHRWDFESCCDGGDLVLGVDGGAPVHVPGSAIVSGTVYNYGGRFTGSQPTFVNTTVDLDAVCDSVLGGGGGCAGHTLSIGFHVSTDGSVVGTGWFLDDVTVTTCTLHGCTGAPVIGTASTPADNQVQVTWSNGAPPSSSFNVYRALGSCAAPGPFERIASGTSGLSYLDTVSGGIAFAYRVEGLDSSGLCESDLSACVEATATGPCTLAPAFAGLKTVADAVQPTCSLGLSWDPASSRCEGSVTYNVYRSTTPGFTPGPGNRIAQGVTGTSYSDQGTILAGTTYYYVVRAVDATNGQEEGNTVRRSDRPTGPLVHLGTLSETFEGTRSGGGFDHDGWTHAPRTGTVDWTWSTLRAETPAHSWFAESAGSEGDQVLVSPSFVAQAGTLLTFRHTYDFEECYDGGTLEITGDGGATWTVLPDSAFLEGGFTGTLIAGTANPIAGKRAWCGGSLGPMSLVRADLSAWAGSQVRLRWHAGEDGALRHIGWFVDSVTIANAEVGGFCSAAPAPSLGFHTLVPCRLIDTRSAQGPRGGPALQPFAERSFALTGVCGIPATAKALSVNLTVTQPAAAGHLTLFPAGSPAPASSSINFSPAQTRANNAILPLGTGGALRVQAVSPGPVHFLLDVNGYFEEEQP